MNDTLLPRFRDLPRPQRMVVWVEAGFAAFLLILGAASLFRGSLENASYIVPGMSFSVIAWLHARTFRYHLMQARRLDALVEQEKTLLRAISGDDTDL